MYLSGLTTVFFNSRYLVCVGKAVNWAFCVPLIYPYRAVCILKSLYRSRILLNLFCVFAKG